MIETPRDWRLGKFLQRYFNGKHSFDGKDLKRFSAFPAKFHMPIAKFPIPFVVNGKSHMVQPLVGWL